MNCFRLGAGALALALFATPAAAQLFGRPPADVPQQMAQAPDIAGVGVRVERLEGQIRNLTGQIEQLQNRNRQLEDQLKRFQQDVEFRFQEAAGGKKPAPAAAPAPGRRSAIEAAPLAGSAAVAAAPISAQNPTATSPAPSPASPAVKVDPGTLGPFAGKPAAAPARPGRGDAFDPAANPAAPGAPRQLGQSVPSAPLPPARGAATASVSSIIEEQDANAPMDLANPRPPAAAGAGEPQVIAAPAAASASVATTDPVRAEYDYALIAFRNGQYDTADALLRQFVQKHPTDKLLADAIYYRGETLLQRGRHADAAEQYLKVTTDFGQSARAPDAMLKLGLSLRQMGAKEQACATFAEIARKHPRASSAIKGAEREMKRASC